jgi:hypothetical protein
MKTLQLAAAGGGIVVVMDDDESNAMAKAFCDLVKMNEPISGNIDLKQPL